MEERIAVSAEWLGRLRGELEHLEERRNRLGQELRQVEAQIMAQTGAVGLMQELLRGQEGELGAGDA